MYSIGRFISNFRDFYNDINGATLTGAIDVVVVQQADGSFTCSPFHVRFGKLGVLRSKEKLVDIEINGEPRDIHMKLGESGEAFFVEGVYEGDDTQFPEHLATSPITTSEFAPTYETTEEQIPKPRRNSIDFTDKFENQVSDFSQRRYTDQSLQKRDFSVQKKEYTTQQLREQEQRMQQSWNSEAQGQESLFSLDSLEGSASTSSVQNGNGVTLKIFKAEQINDENSKDNERSRKVSVINNDFRPIDAQDIEKSAEDIDLNKEDSPKELSETLLKVEDNGKSNNSKKKRRKRSVMKKKSAQRKNSNSSSGGSHSDQMEVEVSEGAPSDNHNSSSGTQEDSSVSSKLTLDIKDDLPSNETSIRIRDPDIHFFSDTEVGSAQSPRGSRPCTPVQSDTEFEVNQRQSQSAEDNNSPGADSQQSWRWGELPSPRPKSNVSTTEATGEEDKKKLDEAKQAERNSMLSSMFSFMKHTKRYRGKPPVEGLYLADLSSEDMDPEVAALYFPTAQIHRKRNGAEGEEEEDIESGNGPSLTQSPSSIEGACGGSKSVDSDFDDNKHHEKHNEEVQLSLCGGLETGGPTNEDFQNHLVPYKEVCENPHLLESPNLVVRLGGKYYNWKTACPIVMTLVVYQQPLPQSSIEQLSDTLPPGKNVEIKTGEIDSTKEPEGRSYWWYWRRPDKKSAEQKLADGKKSLSIDKAPEIVAEAVESKDVVTTENINIPGAQEGAAGTQTSFSNSPEEIHKEDGYSGSQSSEESDIESTRIHIKQRPFPEKYRKTLRLSSEQIESLNLNEGMNEVVFSVTTAYQGTSRCKCYMYRWKYDDKVVISDIDGTITRSDVLGHLLPIVGKDWAQSGVAQLFTKIKNNGYKLLYLSSRAIGQARVTREYLRSIKQNDLSLPDGPLLLNPTSLLSAFHREVIEKKPEQFKISCLSDINALFPAESKPFYAGYGNRINDVWAYRAVGIPIVRIFTINHRGELKHELTRTFQSSYTGQSGIVNDLFPPVVNDESILLHELYSNMTNIVDQLFPPLLEDASEFSHFVYWRDPLPDVPPLTGDPIPPVPSVKSPSPPRGTSPLPTIPENSITN